MTRARPDAGETARRACEAMWAADRASRGLGMTLEEVEPGRATVAMTVTAAMLNGHGTCHGGIIFALADSAFACASNSHGQRSVAQHCTVTFLSPGRLGDRLLARALERSRAGRSGITDVTVARDDGKLIAEFRGVSRTVPGSLLGESG